MVEQNQTPATWASLSAEDYLRERVDDQLDWYSKKSASNKRWYFRLQLFTLVAAASIPVISLSSSDNAVRILVAVIGALTAVAAGVLTLYQFKDQWVDYRSTAETLKYEKYLFMTGASPYTDAKAFSLFTNRVESIIIQENKGWREKKFSTEPDSSTEHDPTKPSPTEQPPHEQEELK